jgi:phosphoglucosamine mutase
MSTPQRQLFGTDGIRGVAGEPPLDERTIFAVGQALGHRWPAPARVVIGQDTRESSEWIGNTLARGLSSAGVQVESAGVITTPGVACLARTLGYQAGVVISASHNPWRDNGIKIFFGDGYKLPDAIEHEIEKEIFSFLEKSKAAGAGQEIATLPGSAELRRAYDAWLARDAAGVRLSNLKVLVDCANGAATTVAPEMFRACSVKAQFIHDKPDGKNINDNCGALHPDVVAEAVTEANRRGEGFDLGITFDGDADRALFSDANGRVINGDAVLLVAARDLQWRGKLANDTVVATTMSNMGLEIALRNSNIRMLRAPVGDKYVLEEMQKTGATLGGEQSGHIIFRDGDATTGDGLLTALRVLEIMARTKQALAELIGDLKVFPQVIKNVRVREKKPLTEVPEVDRAIRAAEGELDGNGRVVVRYSGTEALARVMIEADSEERMNRLADSIVSAIQHALER